MAYFEDDDLSIWNEIHFPIPQVLSDKLLTESKLQELLEKNTDIVQLTIYKWKVIFEIVEYISTRNLPFRFYKSLQSAINYKTCPLCIQSIQQYEKLNGKIQYNDDKCKVCPLSKIDRCVNADSSFQLVAQSIDKGILLLESKIEMSNTEIHQSLIKGVQRMLNSLHQL